MIIFGKGFRGKRLLRKMLKKTLEITGNEVENVCVGVRFVSPEEIQALNKEHRGVDRVTDVLSFPFLDKGEGDKLSQFEAERDPSGVLDLGEIVLCRDKVKQQAKEYGHSFKRELCFLVVHGYLHLLGYDHLEKDQEERMMRLTENVLLNFGLEREDV